MAQPSVIILHTNDILGRVENPPPVRCEDFGERNSLGTRRELEPTSQVLTPDRIDRIIRTIHTN